MKITVYNGEICEIREDGNIYRKSDGKLMKEKTKQFTTISIGKGGVIR